MQKIIVLMAIFLCASTINGMNVRQSSVDLMTSTLKKNNDGDCSLEIKHFTQSGGGLMTSTVTKYADEYHSLNIVCTGRNQSMDSISVGKSSCSEIQIVNEKLITPIVFHGRIDLTLKDFNLKADGEYITVSVPLSSFKLQTFKYALTDDIEIESNYTAIIGYSVKKTPRDGKSEYLLFVDDHQEDACGEATPYVWRFCLKTGGTAFAAWLLYRYRKNILHTFFK